MQITHILDNGPHHCSAVHPTYMARSTILCTRNLLSYNLMCNMKEVHASGAVNQWR
jgi:hypothetical protein